jgi:hypothetical protein
MIEKDTIKLLRECDAGIKMGVSSIEDVLKYVESSAFEERLTKCKNEHDKLADEVVSLLEKYGDDGKNPNPIAKGMSKMKTSVKLGMDNSDETIADLMIEGCDMGIRSLHKYLHQYSESEKSAKELCNRLISIEEELRKKLYKYL